MFGLTQLLAEGSLPSCRARPWLHWSVCSRPTAELALSLHKHDKRPCPRRMLSLSAIFAQFVNRRFHPSCQTRLTRLSLLSWSGTRGANLVKHLSKSLRYSTCSLFAMRLRSSRPAFQRGFLCLSAIACLVSVRFPVQ